MVVKLDFDDLIHRRFLPDNYKSLDMFKQHSCLQTLLSNRRLCLEAFGTKNPMNVIYMTTRPKSKNYQQENVAAKIDNGNGKNTAGIDTTCTADNARDKTTTKCCDIDACLGNDIECLIKSTKECLQCENSQEDGMHNIKTMEKQAEKASNIVSVASKQPENENKLKVDNAENKTPVITCDINANLNCDVERLADNRKKKEECAQSENILQPGKRSTKKAKKRAEGTSKAAGRRKASQKTKLNALEYNPIASSTLADSVTTISSLPALDVNDIALLSDIKPRKEPEEIPINAPPDNLTGSPIVSYTQAKPMAKGKSTMSRKKLTFATPLIDNVSGTAEKSFFEIDAATPRRAYPASLQQATLANFLNIQDHISRKYATNTNGAKKPLKGSVRSVPHSK